jgi:cytidine deaminase
MNIQTVIAIPSIQEIEQEKQFIEEQCVVIGEETIHTLAQRALKQQAYAYVPYSNYKVGVSLLTHEGQIFVGNNAERVSYSETDHAEEAAITSAIIGGSALKQRTFIKAIAVVHAGISAPCGRCRQIIMEHCDNCLIILANPAGEIHRITSAKIILPYAFTPSELGK